MFSVLDGLVLLRMASQTQPAVPKFKVHKVNEEGNFVDLVGEVKTIAVSWDITNPRLDRFMDLEIRCRQLATIDDKKKSLMWIENVKKAFGWQKGKTLYLTTKQNCSGVFFIWKAEECERRLSDIMVCENGFVAMRTYNHYTSYNRPEDGLHFSFMIFPDSLYNDNIARGNLPVRTPELRPPPYRP